jgi:hypothetical protein
MAAAIRRNYCGQLALSHRYRNVGYSSVSRILLLDSNPTRWQCPQTRALPVFTNNGTCAGPRKIDAKDPLRTLALVRDPDGIGGFVAVDGMPEGLGQPRHLRS